jgi:putative ABC transport system permease protein
MSGIVGRVLSLLRATIRRRAAEREMQEEMSAHLAQATERFVSRGMSPELAELAARREFGNVGVIQEESRDARGGRIVDDTAQDLRYALRVLRKAPTFAIVATLTLALGVGVNATMFAVLNSVVLAPLPFRDPGQLVRIFATKNGAIAGGPSVIDIRDVARAAKSFSSIVAYDQWRKNVSGFGGGKSSQAEQQVVGLVPPEFFSTLGIAPIMGRLFTAEENGSGNHYVAAIDRRLWQDRFGGARDVLGKSILINDEPYTIVAVMPDSLPRWLQPTGFDTKIWTPLASLAPDVFAERSRGDRDFTSLARLRPGVSVERARTELTQLGARMASDYRVDRNFGLTLAPLADTRVGPLRDILAILVGAALLVLLTACANLANLLMARNSARSRELLLRSALGAGRSRLFRQMLVETLVLTSIGGLLGLGASLAGSALVSRWHPEAFPQLAGIVVGGRMLAFTAAISLLTGLAFGVGPALATSRVDLAARLRDGGRAVAGGRSRVRSALAAGQLALSLVLVATTALMVQSVSHLETQDLGLRIDHALKAHVYLPPVRYGNPVALARFADEFGASVREIPGVESATIMTGYPPTSQRWARRVEVDGAPPRSASDQSMALIGVGDEWYLRTLGIPLLRGRDLSSADAADASPVAIVNETFERQFSPGATVLGKQIRMSVGAINRPSGTPLSVPRPITIVGVFRDAKNDGLRAPPQPQFITLYRQLPEFNIEFKDLIVRTRGDPLAMTTSIHRALARLDPDMPLAEVATLEDVVARASGGLAYTTTLLAAFALLGLTLATVGVFGVVTYDISQRTAEIGVRMAIGATPRQILWLVLREGAVLGAIGAVVGTAATVAASRLIGGQVFGISAVDPVTFGMTAATLILVALCACLVPAVRAVRIDAIRALREE